MRNDIDKVISLIYQAWEMIHKIEKLKSEKGQMYLIEAVVVILGAVLDDLIDEANNFRRELKK